MKTKDEILQEMKYSDMILELIDNQDNLTRSDLQGCVQAIVMMIIADVKKQQNL